MAGSGKSSLAAHLLDLFETGQGGDVEIIIGSSDEERLSLWLHANLLRRCEYFRSCLAGAFTEGRSQQIILDDVPPKLMKPILRSVYTDRFFADDQVSHYAVDDLFEISLLCRRFLIPDDILASADHAFELSCKKATLTCEKWLEMLIRCVSTIHSDPNPLAAPVLKAFKRDVGENVAQGLLNGEQCLVLLGRCGACLDAGPYLDQASDILSGALGKVVAQVNPGRCLVLLQACGDHPFQVRASEILLAAFQKTLTWGDNVLISLARAIEASLDSAADPCLMKCGCAAAIDVDAVKRELLALDSSDDISSDSKLRATAAASSRISETVEHTPISISRPVQTTAVLDSDLVSKYSSSRGFRGKPRTVSGCLPDSVEVITLGSFEDAAARTVQSSRAREDVLRTLLNWTTSMLVTLGQTERRTRRRIE